MTRARTHAMGLLAVFILLAPITAQAEAISLTRYAVAPATIYPGASGGVVATSTTITVGFSQRVRASIVIKDADGAAVRALYSSSGVTTPNPKIWDGKDDRGTIVAPGLYTVLIAAATSTLTLADSSQQITVASPPSFSPPPLPPESYTFPITAGWNLLSTPVALASSSPAEVFSATSTDAVWSYDPTSPAADASGWLVYSPAHPEFSSLTSVAPGEGYFVHASTTGSVSFAGSLFAPGAAPPSRSLLGGWNLVGSFATSSEPIDDAFATIGWAGLEYTSLWRLNAATQSFLLPSSVGAGDAFWILLDAPHPYAPANL